MDESTIKLIFTWGPWGLILIIFLWSFLVGVIKGRYKVLKRGVYALIYVTVMMFISMPLVDFAMELEINIDGANSVKELILNILEEEETINSFLSYSPSLKETIIAYPEIIVSPILFVILVVIGLPLLFPLYWIYLIFFKIFERHVLKRRKYQVDDDGKYVRNEKGKKIKIKRNKHRLMGGLLNGAKAVALFCVVLMPLNFVNRIYTKAKKVAEVGNDESLCDGLDMDICKYVDMYGNTIFAKIGGEISLDRLVNDYLTTVKINGEKVRLETEVGSVAITAALIKESGILELLTAENTDVENLDFDKIDFDKLSLAIDYIFDSSLLSEVGIAGYRYVMNEVLEDQLVELLKDDDIVSKLDYANAGEMRDELKRVVEIFKLAVEKDMVELAVNNTDDPLVIVNQIKEEDVELLVNKILSIKIINNAMPSILAAYGEEYGVEAPEEMTEELNAEIAGLFSKAIGLVKTIEITDIDEITSNGLEGLTDKLFVNGAIKTDTKEGLAELLNDLNTSVLFKNVASSQINKLLEGKDYNVDARVLRYVSNEDDWMKELTVLEKVYDLYNDYDTNETVNYTKVTELLNSVGETKVIISVLPFAYSEILPQIGIEVDPNVGMPEIDFDGENESVSKDEFYRVWKGELTILKNIADAAGKLELQSLEDVTVDLLNDTDKVDALSTIMGEIYKSDLLEKSFVEFMTDTINEFVVDYGVEFTTQELVIIDTKDEWKAEFTNINKILNVNFDGENEDSITSENLKEIFTAVGTMQLFNVKKIDILKFAVKESGFLTEQEYEQIPWPSTENPEKPEVINNINNFWNNETDVLLDVVEKSDKINVDSINFATLTDDEINNDYGFVLNRILRDSNMLRGVVTNKLTTLLADTNGVKNDFDNDGETTNLKNSIAAVQDWRVELIIIRDMVNSIDGADVSSYKEIVAANRYSKNGDVYTQSNTGNYLKDGAAYYEIRDEIRYNKVAEEYIQSNTGDYLQITIFDSIEKSTLLRGAKATLMLDAVNQVKPTDMTVGAGATVANLRNNDYDVYNKEKAIIVEISENKDVFDTLATQPLSSIDTTMLGDLLDTATKSVIFGDYVKGEIRDLLIDEDNGVRDDRDEGTSTTNLENSIASVTSWKNELDVIKELVNITGTNFTEDVNGKTRIEAMFDSIENSDLLKNTRATLLMKAVNTMNITGVNTDDVSVDSLRGIDGSYTQYDLEVEAVVAFANNRSYVDELTDVTALSGSENETKRKAVAEVLDAIKMSLILKDKYNSTLDTALSEVKENKDLTEHYSVTFNTVDYSTITWSSEYSGDVITTKGELDNLLTINDNIARVKGYDSSTLLTDYTVVIETVGETLDAIEASKLLGETQAQTIANQVVYKLSNNNIDRVSKTGHPTWSAAFDAVLNP